jgi:hypothetical protein
VIALQASAPYAIGQHFCSHANDPALEIMASFPTVSGLQTVPLGPSPMLLNGMVGL